MACSEFELGWRKVGVSLKLTLTANDPHTSVSGTGLLHDVVNLGGNRLDDKPLCSRRLYQSSCSLTIEEMFTEVALDLNVA